MTQGSLFARVQALANAQFRSLLFSQIASVVGEQVFAVAITVSVLNAGGDASTLGLVLAVRGVALVIFLPVGGVWSDRIPRRRIMLAAYGVQAMMAAGLALASTLSFWAAAAAVFVSGVAEAFVRPAFNAILRGVLAEDERVSGRSLISVSVRTGIMLGPALCVALVAVAGTRSAYVVTAVVFLVSAVLFWRVKEPAWSPAPRASFASDIATGVAEARRRPWVLAILLFSTVSLMFVLAPTQVLLPVVSTAHFGSPAVYGVALTCYGIGGLAGGLLTMAWRPRAVGVVAMVSMALYAAAPLSLLLSGSALPIFVCFAVAGAGVEMYAIQWEVALQREIPDHLIGRITSFAWLCSFGLMPFGQALTGPLAELTSTGVVLGVAAAIVLVVPPCLLLVRGMTIFRTSSPGDAPL
ncbi:MFS transporter [Nonomuraea sp. NPDC005983]|uniref:MFS transporter n=1 Tax=Nonomuraea sp. NPDC005983 TaxID=3155595 RepID=UPI0033BCB001